MASSDGIRFDDVSRVVAALVLGGPFPAARPFGSRLALRVGEGRDFVDDDVRSRVKIVRLRRARALAPVDSVPDVDAKGWALACALNDLVQATNPDLSSVFSRERPQRVLRGVRETCAAVAPPKTLRDALGRHATFGGALALVRVDTTVSWWTGQARFRGESPPGRLLAWPGLRRVEVQRGSVATSEMGDEIAGVDPTEFLIALASWLACSPLTDIATLGRRAPAFRWSEGTLALVDSVLGRRLAIRALCRATRARVADVLGDARKALALVDEDAVRTASGFEQALLDSLDAGVWASSRLPAGE